MHLINVDVVGLQPAQRRFERSAHEGRREILREFVLSRGVPATRLKSRTRISLRRRRCRRRSAKALASCSSLRPLPYVSAASKSVMPRSAAARSISIASSSLLSPHQPVAVVQRPKPTSLTVTSLRGYVRYLMRGPSPSASPTPHHHGTVRARYADDFERVGAWIAEYFEHPEAYRVVPDVRPGDVVAHCRSARPRTASRSKRFFQTSPALSSRRLRTGIIRASSPILRPAPRLPRLRPRP